MKLIMLRKQPKQFLSRCILIVFNSEPARTSSGLWPSRMKASLSSRFHENPRMTIFSSFFPSWRSSKRVHRKSLRAYQKMRSTLRTLSASKKP
nr:hypothetical protein SHINE37_80026 [Rhizobiaceae bacterium]